MTIKIKDRWTNRVLHSSEKATLKEALEEAVSNGANLDGANLSRATLDGANLYGATLYGANLYGANLSRATLYGANLDGANLDGIKNDFFEIILNTPNELPGLRLAVVEGRINGSVYEGECACLVGTIAKVRGCLYTAIPGVEPRGGRPIERFFTALKPGDSPDNHPVAKIVVDWIDEFTAKLTAAAALVK
jgi:hypothetical protein